MQIQGRTADEIVASVRSLVAAGRLRSGDPLPAVRQLALTLGINRNTAAAAYRRLNEVGLARSAGRRGTRISPPPSLGEQEGASVDTALVDLADGNPDRDCLPDINRVIHACDFKHSLYGESTFNSALRRYAAAWFDEDCPGDADILVTHGCVDAIERLAQARLVPGDRVAVEDPCFLGTINALRLSAMHAVGVAVDAEGIQPEALRQTLRGGARAVLLTARAQNPTGFSMSRERAAAIAAVLGEHPDVMVIVDDHFALLANTDYHAPIPSTTGSWAVIRSLAKPVGPDIRVALLACDRTTGERLRTRLAPGMTWVSHFLQTLAISCLEDPQVKTLLAESKIQYATRREAMQAALQHVGFASPLTTDGLNVWIPLSCDPSAVVNAMARRGWLVRASTAFEVSQQSRAIRVTTSRLSPPEAERFAAALAEAI
ncbi:aminotransferase class I/II-fold pyridoxal phosphate-dependent enzyme [Salinisphaera sp. Q1T1-3]|nr:aminotransferase class I/II-fold pyridoxal phosphate-dependent enzyme [Salinisphaera sp. Q1T1-3]